MRKCKKLNLIIFLLLVFSCNQIKEKNTNKFQAINFSDSNKNMTNIYESTKTPDTKGKITNISSEDEFNDALKRQFGEDNKDIWGLGILSCIKGNEAELINFPNNPINAYDKPNGEIIGRIIKLNERDQYYKIYFEVFNNKKRIKINIKDLMEISYEGTCIKYYNNQDDYFQCLINIYNEGVWVKSEDLKKQGFLPINWVTFLTQAGECYYPISSKGILIFDSLENVIDTLIRGQNVVKLIKTSNNKLNKVEILKEGECGGCSEIKVGTGWIKIIDEEGHPRIYFYTRGC